MMKRILTSTLIFAGLSGSALAHPGDHGLSVLGSLAHLLTEPDHLAMIAGAVIVAAVAWRWGKRSRA